MIKVFSLAMIFSFALTSISFAESSVPPGVKPENWIPITDSYGMVVVSQSHPTDELESQAKESKEKEQIKENKKQFLGSVDVVYMVLIDDVWYKISSPIAASLAAKIKK